MESDEAVALWERTRDRLAPLLDQVVDGDLAGLEPVAGAGPAEPPPPTLYAILEKVAAVSSDSLLAGADEFARTWSPVGILPPDQYMALVVQLTHGCRFNACTFCAFYRDTPFSATDGDGLREHLTRIDSFLGEGIGLRRSIFLGDANALVLPTEDLLPLLDIVAAHYRGTPPWSGGMHTFLDGFSGAKKEPDEYRRLRERGLRRICIGMESGHDPLLRWLNKPGTVDDVITTVTAMKVAGLEVSLVEGYGILQQACGNARRGLRSDRAAGGDNGSR